MKITNYHWRILPSLVNANHYGSATSPLPLSTKEHQESLDELEAIIDQLLLKYPLSREEEDKFNRFDFEKVDDTYFSNFHKLRSKIEYFNSYNERIRAAFKLLLQVAGREDYNSNAVSMYLLTKLPVEDIVVLVENAVFDAMSYDTFLNSVSLREVWTAQDLTMLLKAFQHNYRRQRDIVWIAMGGFDALQPELLEVIFSYGFTNLLKPSVYIPYARQRFNLPEGLSNSCYRDSLEFGRVFGDKFIKPYPESCVTDTEKLQYIFDQMVSMLLPEEVSYLQALIKFTSESIASCKLGVMSNSEDSEAVILNSFVTDRPFLATATILALLIQGDEASEEVGVIEARKSFHMLMMLMLEAAPACIMPAILLLLAEREAYEAETGSIGLDSWNVRYPVLGQLP